MPVAAIPAVIAGVGAVAGAAGSIIGGNKAAAGSKAAADLQQQQYWRTREDLQPYNLAGQAALPQMQYWAGAGPTGGGPDYVAQAASLAPGRMTQQELEATPGYTFTRDQGLKAVQSAAAARGLGVSGSSLKGAAEFATGLADRTYIDQFNLQQKRFENALALNTGQQGQLTNMWSRLSGLGTLGENAAAKTGEIGQNLTGAGAIANAAQLQGSGFVNATNALQQGAQGYLGYDMLQQMLKNQGNTGTTGGYASGPSGFDISGYYNPSSLPITNLPPTSYNF